MFPGRLAGGTGNHSAILAGLLLALAAGLATFLPADAVATLGWQRADPARWSLTLFSAHFVHLGPAHLAFNLPVALLLAWACDRHGLSGRLPAAALVSLAGVDLGLLLGPWRIDWYVGLSGGLHGLFAWLTLRLALDGEPGPGRALAALLCTGGGIKVLADLAVPVGAMDWRAMPLATPVHLYGYLAGAFWAVFRRDSRIRPSRPASPSRE